MSIRAHIWAFAVAGLAGLAVPVCAEEIVVLGMRTGDEPSLAVASGGVLTMSLLMPVSLKASGLVADLWQMADAVTVPLVKGRSLDEAATEADAHGVSTVRVAFPEVKRKTPVLVKFFTNQEPTMEIGRSRVWVYPPLNWRPVARKFKEESPRLVVFGRSEALRTFLKQRGLAFADQGEAVPEKLEAGVLAVGGLPDKIWRESKPRLTAEGGRLVVFVDGAPGLPGVYTTVNGAGVITQITLPVLDALAEDPRAEDTFFQIIEQHLHSAPAAIF
jgi:hypothetical protein